MWIQDNKTIIKTPKSITVNGVTHPRQIFKDAQSLADIGIVPYSENKVNDKYYWQGELTIADGVGTYAEIPRDVDTLKKGMIEQSRATASSILARDDWMSIRESEGGTAMASNLKSYRADVRTESGTKETEINALADLAAIKLYDATPYTQVSKVWDNDSEDWGSDTVSRTVQINMSVHYEAVDPNAEVDPSSVSLTKD